MNSRSALAFLFLLPLLRAQDVPCEKYRLDNGLTVILHEDHSLPLVTIDTWFRVGARNEPKGRSGFAHLFEHLMFMGTERVPGNQFDVIMESGGGWNNASTSLDRTNYFSQGPSELLPTLLWLDADRLEDLARAMDKDKLDKQRDVVRNEIRQNVENRPYGRAQEAVFGMMFPEGHPYHDAVYGTHEDLQSATVSDVKDFFATFYVPNNATLVIVGDFDAAQAKDLVQRLFGSIRRGADVPVRTPEPPRLQGVVRRTMIDKVQLPLVKMVWHSPASFADGDAEMRLLASVLSGGKDSRLYRRMVMDERIAVDVSAYQDGAALGSLFQIDVTAVEGADLDRAEAIVREEIARVQREGMDEDELERRKAGHEFRTLSSLQNQVMVADMLNQYENVWAEPNSFARDLARYRAATPEIVQTWAQAVLDPERCGVIRVLPETPAREQGPRDERPRPSSAGSFEPQQPESFRLENGIPALLWRKPELPLVSMRVQFQRGAPLTVPERAGLSVLAARMLSEGAGDLDAVQFSAALQKLGASFSVGADHETATASLSVLKRNFGEASRLLVEALRRPRMAEEDWERVKRLHLDELRQRDDDPTSVASRVAMRVLFGEANPYGWPVDGTLETVLPITLEDAKRECARVFDPANAVLLIAGDLTVDEAKRALDPLVGDWRREEPPEVRAPALDAVLSRGLRLFVVDRPDAVQTVIRLSLPGPRYADERRVACLLIGTVLGGSFTSRLNQNLREKHGYTYGARCSFSMSPWSGWFSAGASVQAEVTGAALKEFLAEIERLCAGKGDIGEEEAGKAKKTLRTGTVGSFAGLNGILSTASDLVLNGLPFDRVRLDLEAMQAASAARLNEVAGQVLRLDAGVLVLVGDARRIREQLQGLGLPEPVEVGPDGRPR